MRRLYIVRQGDYLAAIAARFNLDADQIWDDPANAELKSRRASPHLLAPGDQIALPEPYERPTLRLQVGATNRFSARTPTIPVTLFLRNADGPASIFARSSWICESVG